MGGASSVEQQPAANPPRGQRQDAENKRNSILKQFRRASLAAMQRAKPGSSSMLNASLIVRLDMMRQSKFNRASDVADRVITKRGDRVRRAKVGIGQNFAEEPAPYELHAAEAQKDAGTAAWLVDTLDRCSAFFRQQPHAMKKKLVATMHREVVAEGATIYEEGNVKALYCYVVAVGAVELARKKGGKKKPEVREHRTAQHSMRALTGPHEPVMAHKNAMPCHAMPCYAMPCHAMPCHAMLCHAMRCSSAARSSASSRCCTPCRVPPRRARGSRRSCGSSRATRGTPIEPRPATRRVVRRERSGPRCGTSPDA
jgi:hypothetical protein